MDANNQYGQASDYIITSIWMYQKTGTTPKFT